MELRSLNANELNEYIQSKEYIELDHIPITVHRAKSHISNPRLDPEDIILILAFEENKMIGYLGILPDKFYLDGKEEKVGWLTCLWIHPAARGQGVAKQLLAKSYEEWDQRLMITEFTSEAYLMYKKSGYFNDLPTLKGTRAYIRFDMHKLLVRKYPLFKPLKPLIWLMDGLLNWGLDGLAYWSSKVAKDISPIDYTVIESLSQTELDFMQTNQRKNLFNRTIVELNWIHDEPWILQRKRKSSMDRKYYFSASEGEFETLYIKINDANKQLIGVFIVTLRNREMKLPYSFYQQDEINNVLNGLFCFMLDKRVKMISTFNESLAEALKDSKGPFILKRTISRPYVISTKFKNEMDEIVKLEIMDGDGDAAFT